MYGMTQRELVAPATLTGPSMLDKIVQHTASDFTLPAVRPDIRDYVTLAVRGGFPAVLLGDMSPAAAVAWIDSYLEQLLTRDTYSVVGARDRQKLEAYFRAVAAMSAGLPEHKTLYDAAAMDQNTTAHHGPKP